MLKVDLMVYRLLRWWLFFHEAQVYSYKVQNFVNDLSSQNVVDFPICLKDSVCGFLQSNRWGISSVQVCTCWNRPCTSYWDAFGGNSINQGRLEQYKFCGEAPILPICDDGVAYNSLNFFDENGVKVAVEEQLLCVCPEYFGYVNSKYKTYRHANMTVVAIKYYCRELPMCKYDEYCQDVTEVETGYLVHPNCICERGSVCSMDREVDTIRIGKSAIHRVKCQKKL